MDVTPRAGVWIETTSIAFSHFFFIVTPRAGVWIETRTEASRGTIPGVTPRAGVWIETSHAHRHVCSMESPPVRGCGLKLFNPSGKPFHSSTVTPRAGVWIETLAWIERWFFRDGHPPCGGVD